MIRLRHLSNSIKSGLLFLTHIIILILLSYQTIFSHEQEPKIIMYVVQKEYNSEIFFLTHPDLFQIKNSLIDDNFNITDIIEWSGCQKMPLESRKLITMGMSLRNQNDIRNLKLLK